jgi:hypothetical protein
MIGTSLAWKFITPEIHSVFSGNPEIVLRGGTVDMVGTESHG